MERLLRKRATSRTWLAKASQSLLETVDKDGVSEVELRLAMDEFTVRLNNLDIVQDQIEQDVMEDILQETVEEAIAFRKEQFEAKIKAEILIQKMKEKNSKVTTQSSNSETNSNENRHFPHARLPQLELQKFSGNYLEFNSFYDKFVAVVDGSDLPAVTKFTYLQSLLTGEAFASIKGLSVTEESYPVAKEILTKRFGRRERIIFAHIQKLLSLQVDFRKSSGLWSLYDSLQTHIRCLETLGVSGTQYGVILTPLVLSRIPNDIRLEWAREGEGRESDLEFLLDFLYKEIKRRERSQTFQKPDLEKKAKDHSLPSVAAFHSYSVAEEKCSFCKKRHRSEDCCSLQRLSMEELMKKVKEMNLCFICFGRHFSKKCRSRKLCQLCRGQHNSLLCRNKAPVLNDRHAAASEETTSPSKVNYAHFEHKNKTTLMQVVKTKMKAASGNLVAVNVLFDGGSDRSFMTEALAKVLCYKQCHFEKFAFSGFGGMISNSGTKRKVYNVELGGVDIDLAEINTICNDMFRAPVPVEVLNKFDIEFTEDMTAGRSMHIDILIGLDFYWKLVTREMVQVDALVAQKTRCGWMLSGQYLGRSKQNGVQLLCLENIPENLIRSAWELDSMGISGSPMDTDKGEVLKRFNDTVSYQDGRYCVSLPWKDDMKGKLMNNLHLAEKRSMSLSRKLAGKPDLKTSYDQTLRDMETAGIIKEVSDKDKNAHPVFYMPHRPVVKEDSKTSKVRPVFDASAKGYNSISLNDCLETGPNLLPNLLEMLLRFRRWKIAVTADVSKAFLQIKVHQSDQPVLRFLWECDGMNRIMGFDRVPFGLKSSPFLLNATVKHHLEKYPSDRIVRELQNNLYVDDFLSGADTVEDACLLVAGAKKILSEAGMDLTKWSSNDDCVAGTIMKEFDPRFDVTDSTKVLGLKWIPTEDSFSFNGLEIPDTLLVTKRLVLSFIARLFDPLGFLTPFTICAKILFQELWELGVEWDTELPDPQVGQFVRWVRDIDYLQDWKIPRSFVQLSWTGASEKQIHVFCDASEKAYGCCAYLRLKEGQTTSITLIMSKAKVAPLKRVTLPRLELLAAVLGARMMRLIRDSLFADIHCIDYRFYTDSMITLQWIQSESNRWKTFVANRVQEIQDLTDPASWTHCAGTENPADMLTRGISASKLMTSSLWLRGPEWLSHAALSTRSNMEIGVCQGDIQSEELLTQCVSVETQPFKPMFQMENCSSLKRAIRVMGWICKFVDRCRKKTQVCPHLSNDELSSAFQRLLLVTQSSFFREEIELLGKGKPINKSSSILNLCPFFGENRLLRARCRLNYSDLSYDEKFPVILPKCHISLLLVRQTHFQFKHAGVNQMIANLRNQYWIIGLRSLARKVKGECLLCKIMDAKACQEPVAPIMEARLKQTPPFSTVGVDYFGPLHCKDFGGKKFYILLFTCAIIRGVHLEMVESLSLPNFMLAFRRFVSRRGLPAVIFSDNAKTFKGAASEIFKVYGSNSPKWRFSVPRAPWWGGWWERMVKTVKTALKKTVGIKCLEKVKLETILIEVEACVNSRPLTFVGDNLENGHPLSPSHFLLGRGSHLDKVSYETSDIHSLELKDHITMLDARLDMFWTKWQNEYLKQLPLPKGKGKFGHLHIGSVVLIREDNCRRLQWPLGVVEELIKGRDGVIRTVKVKTKTGSFTRPIQRIHDLELHGSPSESHPDISLLKPEEPCSGNKEVLKTRSGRVVKPPVRP